MLQSKLDSQSFQPAHQSMDLTQFFKDPICGAIEALLFAADKPLSMDELEQILLSQDYKTTRQQIQDIIHMLIEIYNQPGRGLQLQQVAGGWQFRSNQAYAMLIRQMRDPKTPRFTQAAMECLSVIAYRQPVTRGEIDAIRGVDSGGVLAGLRDRGLVEVAGRSHSPGRPYLYQTSPTFLEFFGLSDLHELPDLANMAQMNDDEE